MGSKSNSKSSKGSKQNGNKANGGKNQPQETNRVEKGPNGEQQNDCSLLRKPIDIGLSNVGQIVKAYGTGSPEVQQLLRDECDIVLECKVCRNLFRSYANFLSHKRVYCREQYSDSKRVFPSNHLIEDSTTVIQPEAVCSGPETWVTSDFTPTGIDFDDPSLPQIETSIPRITSSANPKKDLSQIIERLTQQKGVRNVTETVAHISASKFYETVTEQLKLQKDARKEHVIRLEAMENTKYGMFQTVLQSSSTVQMENTDLMKDQVVELHNMMTRNEATLGPDGQVAMLNGEGTTHLAITAASSGGKDGSVKKHDNVQHSKSVSPKENHVCTICNTKFSTRKTLSHHMKSLHVTFRMCYPCPCCKNTFSNTWSVYRHLYKVHRKTNLQVRKLRSQIVNKAFRKEVSEENHNGSGKTQAPAPQTEADKARKEQQRLHQENQDWMNNFEDDLELQMCGGCGRRFERKAALNSHSQICQKRIAVQNNIKSRRQSPPNTSVTSNKVTNTKLPAAPPSDRHNLPYSENSKNENTSTESRLTPLFVQSDNGQKCNITPSPSPVPHDQFLSSSPGTSFHRTRHCSGGSVSKKDVPEKRIEIQIRRDYCKTGTSSGSVSSASCGGGSLGHQHDCNSESNENLLTCGSIVEGNENEASNEDVKVYQARELGTGVLRKDNDTPTLTVCRYPARRDEGYLNDLPMHTLEIDDCDEDDDFDDKSSIQSIPDDSELRSSNQSDRSTNSKLKLIISEDSPESEKSQSRRMSNSSDGQEMLQDESQETNSRRTSDVSEEPMVQSPPSTTKKEEQFSPVMENRMQKMINIRRMQCLPCQKRFNKLTNLRRHVAVHIGWNRYRCTACPFKCFSKYDCVAHVNKMHLEKVDRDKAQSMVEYIETQETEVETDSLKNEPTVEEKKEADESTKLELQNENEDGSLKEWSLQWPTLENGESKSYSNCNSECSPVKIEEVTDELCIVGEPAASKSEAVYSESEKTSETASVQSEGAPRLGRGRPRKHRASCDSMGADQNEPVPSKRLLTMAEYEESIKELSVPETETKPKVNDLEIEASTDNEASEANETPEDSPHKAQDLQQQTALRKMVLQVIFGGAASSTSPELDHPENMLSITMNGERGHSGGSASSPEPYEVVETVSSDSATPVVSSTTSPISTSDDLVDVSESSLQVKEERSNKQKLRNSVTPTFEIERRQRPVRNRVRVEREDFIYDLSDRCLDPKKDGEDKNKNRRKQDNMKALLDKGSYSADNSTRLPKLMLVRTNMGEFSGVKVMKSSSNSSTSSNMSDSSTLGYNISTRKSQRTFDISPHKTSKQQ